MLNREGPRGEPVAPVPGEGETELREARKALHYLALEVPSSVHSDVCAKVESAFAALLRSTPSAPPRCPCGEPSCTGRHGTFDVPDDLRVASAPPGERKDCQCEIPMLSSTCTNCGGSYMPDEKRPAPKWSALPGEDEALRAFGTSLLRQYDRLRKSGQDNFGAALCIVQPWEAEKLRAALSSTPVGGDSELRRALEQAREAIASLPADALGEGSAATTLPSGESGEMRWPIRDELVDSINRALAGTPAPSKPRDDPPHGAVWCSTCRSWYPPDSAHSWGIVSSHQHAATEGGSDV
jgi:hypothetical protein